MHNDPKRKLPKLCQELNFSHGSPFLQCYFHVFFDEVELGHPGLNASSSDKTLRHPSGVVTMMLGLPNMKALEKGREYLEANEAMKESGLLDLKALRKDHMLPMKGQPKSPGGKDSLFLSPSFITS
nr:hypothetical protein Iba_chr12cCG0830 [Ipomoea batatas]